VSKSLCDGFVGHQIGRCLTARRQIALLAEGDHLLDRRTHGLRLDHGRLDALFHDDRRDHVAQHGAPVRSGSSEFVSRNFVTHVFTPVVSVQFSVLSCQDRELASSL
jgi:hypothetical protein